MKNAFRIGYYRYADDKIFREHINAIKRNIEYVDEVALFVEFAHHGYWPLDREKEHAKLLSARMNEYRKAGVKSVGINPLDTIGHTEEAWDVLGKPYMQTMVGIDGKVSKSCLCYNTDEFIEYIIERYEILAGTGPDFIWLDDDIRVFAHGVAGPCYCEHCIAKFNKKTGRKETFESLAKSEDETLNKLWYEFHVDCITELCGIIKDTIKKIDKNIQIGLMTTSLCDSKEWFYALEAAKARPGGGFYNDKIPNSLAEKLFACEYQIESICPTEIEDIQYEYENFPYADFGKSKTLTELEILFALFSGVNGVAYNALYYNNNAKLFDVIAKNNELWKQVVKRTKNSVVTGVYSRDGYGIGKNFLCLSVPMTSFSKSPCAVSLDKETVSVMSDDQLKAALSKTAFVTGDGFELIEKRGFAHLCGVSTNKIYTNGVYERFTDDDINGSVKGEMRNTFVTFGGKRPRIATLNINKNARVLSTLYTLMEEELGPCFTVYENELGGKVAVMTYVDCENLEYIPKRTQILNVFDYICGGLPLRVLSDCRIAPVIRKNADGGFLALLANMDFDACCNVQVEISTDAESCVIINRDGFLKNIPITVLSNGKKLIEIEKIEPWSAVVVADK